MTNGQAGPMPQAADAEVQRQLTQLTRVLNRRLRLTPAEALEVVVDATGQVHLEQRRSQGPWRCLTVSMAADRLLALVEGMGLALDLDRGLASRVMTRTAAFRQLAAADVAAATGAERPREPR